MPVAPHSRAGRPLPSWAGFTQVERSTGEPERGSGLFGTWFGMVVILVAFLFAVQVLFDLQARSVVTAVAYDAARRVAAADGQSPAPAQARAEADARRALGRYGNRVRFQWRNRPDAIRLHVVVDNPRLGLASFSAPLGLDHIDRTVVVRVERPQP